MELVAALNLRRPADEFEGQQATHTETPLDNSDDNCNNSFVSTGDSVYEPFILVRN